MEVYYKGYINIWLERYKLEIAREKEGCKDANYESSNFIVIFKTTTKSCDLGQQWLINSNESVDLPGSGSVSSSLTWNHSYGWNN